MERLILQDLLVGLPHTGSGRNRACPRQALQQRLGTQFELQHVIGRTAFHRLPHERKIIITAQGDDIRRRIGLFERADKGNPIHARHFHVGNHNVRPMLLSQCQRLLGVPRLADQQIAMLPPVYQRF